MFFVLFLSDLLFVSLKGKVEEWRERLRAKVEGKVGGGRGRNKNDRKRKCVKKVAKKE